MQTINASNDNKPWTCGKCTYQNRPLALACEICFTLVDGTINQKMVTSTAGNNAAVGAHKVVYDSSDAKRSGNPNIVAAGSRDPNININISVANMTREGDGTETKQKQTEKLAGTTMGCVQACPNVDNDATMQIENHHRQEHQKQEDQKTNDGNKSVCITTITPVTNNADCGHVLIDVAPEVETFTTSATSINTTTTTTDTPTTIEIQNSFIIKNNNNNSNNIDICSDEAPLLEFIPRSSDSLAPVDVPCGLQRIVDAPISPTKKKIMHVSTSLVETAEVMVDMMQRSSTIPAVMTATTTPILPLVSQDIDVATATNKMMHQIRSLTAIVTYKLKTRTFVLDFKLVEDLYDNLNLQIQDVFKIQNNDNNNNNNNTIPVRIDHDVVGATAAAATAVTATTTTTTTTTVVTKRSYPFVLFLAGRIAAINSLDEFERQLMPMIGHSYTSQENRPGASPVYYFVAQPSERLPSPVLSRPCWTIVFDVTPNFAAEAPATPDEWQDIGEQMKWEDLKHNLLSFGLGYVSWKSVVVFQPPAPPVPPSNSSVNTRLRMTGVIGRTLLPDELVEGVKEYEGVHSVSLVSFTENFDT